MPRKPASLFIPVVAEDKLHPSVKLLMSDGGCEPGRKLLEKIFQTYDDIDGNFVKDFQTVGFDQRLWELYLWAYLSDAHPGRVERPKPHPDFAIIQDERKVFIEATTAAESKSPNFSDPPPSSQEERDARLRDEIPIRLGSPLFSKLSKHYWQKPHVSGRPLVIAIAMFHELDSQQYWDNALLAYLFGQRWVGDYDGQSQLRIATEPIEHHRLGQKEIPSGFFLQPDAEHVSAVLFSNSGTVAKFQRMAQQDGSWRAHHQVIRYGYCYPGTNGIAANGFFYLVGHPDSPKETWAQGVSVSHNPRALHPIEDSWFPGAIHHRLKNGVVNTVGIDLDFHPITSRTKACWSTEPNQFPEPSVAFEIIRSPTNRR